MSSTYGSIYYSYCKVIFIKNMQNDNQENQDVRSKTCPNGYTNCSGTYRKQRSLFQSKVFWGAVLSLVAGLTPVIRDCVVTNSFTPDDAAKIVLIFVASGYSVLGRLQEQEERIFTPELLPGPNKLPE